MEPLGSTPPELLQPQSAPRAGTAAADAPARWRLELERAQWRLRSDAKPVQSAPANSGGAGDVPHKPAATNPRTATEQDLRGAQGNSAAAEPPSAKGAPQAGPQEHALRSGARNGPSAIAAARQERPYGPSRPPAQPQAAASRAPQRAAWPNVSAHALVDAGQVKAWIRDASLGEAERRRLLRELRARLRAAGLQLETLTVNGREESD